MSRLLSSASASAFSGARCPHPDSLVALRKAVAAVPPSARVLVGCCRGVDAAVRSLVPRAEVFRASSFGSGRSSFARRSCAVVSAAAAAGGVFVSFPSSSCPAGLLPSAFSSACFCGLGSGSWASAAFAVGSGVPVLLFLPPGVLPPAGWGFVSGGRGWFLAEPAPCQLSLAL